MRKICFYLLFIIIIIFSCKNDKIIENRFFENDSSIVISEYSDKNIENLFVLCKVWGVIRFYHPSIVKGEIDLDSELFKILPNIVESRSVKERNNLLNKWIRGLGAVQSKQYTIGLKSIKIAPNFKWIDSCNLENVASRLIKIVNTPQDIYSIEDSILLVENILQVDKVYHGLPSFPNVGFRLLTLFRYWNIVEYFFPYKYLIGEDWDKILLKFIPEFIKVDNEYDYKLLILELITSINDGHATIVDSLINKQLGESVVPVKLNFIENKIVVFEQNAGYDAFKVGDVIIAVNGQSVDSIIEQRQAYTPASNYPAKLHRIAKNILRTNDSILEVRYERDGHVYVDSFKTDKIDRVFLNNNQPLYRYLYNDVYYINLMSGIGGTIPDSIDAKGIIIDLRGYPNIGKVFNIDMDFLYSQAVECARFTVPIMPGLFVFKRGISTTFAGKNNRNYFKGKTVILINSETQSFAEFMAMRYKHASNTILLGSNSAGADGDIITITLPGNIKTTMSGLGIYYPDGRETQRVGIIPDVEVYPTLVGVRENRDELLERALSFIKNGYIEESEKR